MTVALVTGAGSGLGRAITRRLLERGLHVALVGRREAPLRETADGSERARVLPADVREPDQVRAVIEAVRTWQGRLDVVVGCAALLGEGDDPTMGTWRRFACVLQTNVLGAALVTEEAAALLGPGGVVVHVGSSVAELPTPEALAYGASKAALAHLVASLHVRHASRRVRVLGLAPGDLRGDALDAAADAVLFLASRQGRHFAGTMVRMDGGEVPRERGPGPGGRGRTR